MSHEADGWAERVIVVVIKSSSSYIDSYLLTTTVVTIIIIIVIVIINTTLCLRWFGFLVLRCKHPGLHRTPLDPRP